MGEQSGICYKKVLIKTVYVINVQGGRCIDWIKMAKERFTVSKEQKDRVGNYPWFGGCPTAGHNPVFYIKAYLKRTISNWDEDECEEDSHEKTPCPCKEEGCEGGFPSKITFEGTYMNFRSNYPERCGELEPYISHYGTPPTWLDLNYNECKRPRMSGTRAIGGRRKAVRDLCRPPKGNEDFKACTDHLGNLLTDPWVHVDYTLTFESQIKRQYCCNPPDDLVGEALTKWMAKCKRQVLVGHMYEKVGGEDTTQGQMLKEFAPGSEDPLVVIPGEIDTRIEGSPQSVSIKQSYLDTPLPNYITLLNGVKSRLYSYDTGYDCTSPTLHCGHLDYAIPIQYTDNLCVNQGQLAAGLARIQHRANSMDEQALQGLCRTPADTMFSPTQSEGSFKWVADSFQYLRGVCDVPRGTVTSQALKEARENNPPLLRKCPLTAWIGARLAYSPIYNGGIKLCPSADKP